MLAEPVAARIKKSAYTLPPGTPGCMDLTTVFQEEWAWPIETRAIYACNGADLCYNVAQPGHARPTRFATEPGDGCMLVVLRRDGAPK